MADRSIVVRLRAEVADFKRQMDQAARATKKVGEEGEQSTARANTSLGRMVQSAQRNREAWTTAGASLTAFGAVTTLALAGTVRSAIQWESAWTGVLKTVNGTPAQLAEVEDGLRSLTSALPASHTEIAAVAEAAGQLGIQTGSVVDFTKVMIDLGESTNLSAEEAATSLARFANVMGTRQTDFDRLGSAIVGLGNNFATTESEIVAMAMRLSGAGRQISLSEGEVLGLAAAMSSVGIEAEAGGTAMSLTMKRIGAAVENGGTDLEMFAAVAGMTSADFARAWGQDAASALVTFVGGLSETERLGMSTNAVLTELGITGVREADALLRLSSAQDVLTSAMTRGNDEWAANTALVEEANKRYDTAEAKLAIAKNALNDAGITIGQTLLPAIAGGAEAVVGLVEAFSGLPDPVQRALGGLGGVAGVASLAAGGFLLLFPRVLETVKAFRALSAAHPGFVTGLGKVGKAAGIATAALVALSVAGSALGPKMDGSSIAQYTDALLGLGAAARNTDDTPRLLQDLAGSFELVTNPDWWQSANDAVRWFGELFGVTSDVEIRRREFDALGQSLTSLYESDPDLAAERFEEILAQTGGTTEELLDLMPAYRDALLETSSAQEIAEGTSIGLSGATEELTEAQEALVEALGGGSSAFLDFTRVFDDEGNYRGFEAYVSELEEMVRAQDEWERNMLLLAPHVSESLLTTLAEMGPQAAPLVADLWAQIESGSMDGVERLEGVMREGGSLGVGEFVGAVMENAPVIEAAMSQLGADAALAIAAALSSGSKSVEQVIQEYGFIVAGYAWPTIDLNADTSAAVAELHGYEVLVDEASGTVTVNGDPAPAETTLGDLIGDIDASDGTVRINGNKVPADMTLADYVRSVNAARGTVQILASTSSATASLNSWITTNSGKAIQVRVNAVSGTPISAPQYTALPRNAGGIIPGYVGGGRMVPGNPPADRRVDNVLAAGPSGLIALRSGEYVSTEDATRRNLPALEAANRGATLGVIARGYSSGGQVDVGQSVGGWRTGGPVAAAMSPAWSGALDLTDRTIAGIGHTVLAGIHAGISEAERANYQAGRVVL